MHFSVMGKMIISFIDSDFLYIGAIKDRFDCI